MRLLVNHRGQNLFVSYELAFPQARLVYELAIPQYSNVYYSKNMS